MKQVIKREVSKDGRRLFLKLEFVNKYGAAVWCDNFNELVEKRIYKLQIMSFEKKLHFGKIERNNLKGQSVYKNQVHSEIISLLQDIQNFPRNSGFSSNNQYDNNKKLKAYSYDFIELSNNHMGNRLNQTV